MKKKIINTGIITTISLVFLMSTQNCSMNNKVKEASNVIGRVLPEYSDQFVLKLIDKDGTNDVFEIEPHGKKIIIRGSSGVAICSGFNFYLKNICNAVYNW